MLENGYIRAYRSIVRWGWYKDIPTCKLWLHLLLCANYEPCEFMGRKVQAGELVTSYASLAEGSGLSIQQVRTALSKLKKTGEIEVATNRHYTVITITKYGLYQQTDNTQSTDNQHTDNTPVTDNQQSANSQVTTMEESKKARKQESKKSIGDARGASPSPETLNERFPALVAESLLDWLAYKRERREGYKPMGLKSLLTEVERNVQRHGAQPVADVIRLSMSNGWSGIIWDRIRPEKDKPQASVAENWETEWIAEIQARKQRKGKT